MIVSQRRQNAVPDRVIDAMSREFAALLVSRDTYEARIPPPQKEAARRWKEQDEDVKRQLEVASSNATRWAMDYDKVGTLRKANGKARPLPKRERKLRRTVVAWEV